MPPDEKIYKSSFKGLKFLIADDNNVSHSVTRRLLQELGFQKTEVDLGCRCLMTLLQSGSAFQFVFMEVFLAQMDGYEVAFRIRQKLKSRNCPLVVALTASTDNETMESPSCED